MKKWLIAVFLVVFGISFAWGGDDLAETARKEKARREEIAKKKKESKVYTNEDVKESKGQLGIESTSEEGAAEEAVEGTETSAPAPASAPDTSAMDRQVEELQAQIEEQQKIIDDAKAQVDAGGLYQTRDPAAAFRAEREARQKIEELQKQIADVKQQKQDAIEKARTAEEAAGQQEQEAPTEGETEEQQ